MTAEAFSGAGRRRAGLALIIGGLTFLLVMNEVVSWALSASGLLVLATQRVTRRAALAGLATLAACIGAAFVAEGLVVGAWGSQVLSTPGALEGAGAEAFTAIGMFAPLVASAVFAASRPRGKRLALGAAGGLALGVVGMVVLSSWSGAKLPPIWLILLSLSPLLVALGLLVVALAREWRQPAGGAAA